VVATLTGIAKALSGELRAGFLRDKAIKLGLGTEEDVMSMADAWEEWAKVDDGSLAMINGEIVIQK
jgi:hypothetical protein